MTFNLISRHHLIRSFSTSFQDCLRHCIELIENLFLSDTEDRPANNTNDESMDASSHNNRDSAFGQPETPPSEDTNENKDKGEQDNRQSDNATPTEVFEVDALCVAWNKRAGSLRRESEGGWKYVKCPNMKKPNMILRVFVHVCVKEPAKN